MKRWLAILISGILLFAVAGCDGGGDAAVSSAGGTVDCTFEAQYIRHGGSLDHQFPQALIFSKAELEQYLESMKVYIYDKQIPPSLETAAKAYDDTFFEDHILALIPVTEPSGSIRHKVTSVTTENGVTTITVNRYSTENQTCDMGYWHIFVELRRDQAGSELKTEISEALGTMEEYEASN